MGEVAHGTMSIEGHLNRRVYEIMSCCGNLVQTSNPKVQIRVNWAVFIVLSHRQLTS
jgi:hypothetical protein